MAQLKLQVVVDDKGVHVIDQVGAKIQNFERQTSQSFGNLNSIWSKSLSLLGGFAAVSGIGVAIKSVLDMADATAKMSQRLGISVEQLSEYRHIAELSGTSFETLAKGVQILSRNMVDTSQGTGEAKEAFKALGINVKETDGKLKDSNTVLLEVAEKFSKVDDGAAKTALAMKIFGKSGAELIPMLNEGKERLAELGAEADKLGIKMSSEMAAAAEEVNDNLDRMKAAATGVAIQLVQELLPALNATTSAVVEAVYYWREFFKEQFPATGLDALKGQRQEIEKQIVLLSERSKAWKNFGWSTDALDAELNKLKRFLETVEKSITTAENEIQATPEKKPRAQLLFGPTDEQIKKAEAEREKWLSGYLHDVDARWKAEVELSSRLGELAVENMRQEESDRKKWEKLEEQSNKILYDMVEARTKKQKEEAEKTSESIKAAITGWASDFSRSLNDALWEADFTFGNIAKSFAKMITQMAIQLQIIDPLLKKVFSASGSGGGFWEKFLQSLGGAAGTTSAGGAASSEWAWLATTTEASVMHGGGTVGAIGVPRKTVPATVFVAAPRLHSGLARDEYPAILQRGETVIPKGVNQEVNVLVNVNNNTGSSVTVEQNRIKFDGQQWVLDMWLDGFTRNVSGLRDMIGRG